MKVFVAHHAHKYDDDFRVFDSAEKAEAWRQALAQEWWEHELDEAMPQAETPKVIADLYFQAVGERMGSNEYFYVNELEVE